MMPLPDSLRTAVNNYLDGKSTPEETAEVNAWFYGFDDSQVEIAADDEDLANRMKEHILNGITHKIQAGQRRPSLLRSLAFRVSAAAAILVLVLAVSFVLFRQQDKDEQASIHAVADNIKPGGNRATLVLGDGTIVTLDSTGRRVLQQKGSSVHQLGGRLHYASVNETDFSYNILNTPRGSQFEIELTDGTRVWLNAASSIRYPTAFTGKNRKVEITGEAYFEVAKDPSRPFLVEVNKDMQVEVLGTHFNVNAYADEKSISTTLLEGAVQIRAGAHSQALLPGQQGNFYSAQQPFSVTNNANVAQVMAWKNGFFDIRNMELGEVMRLLSRWYDFEVRYSNGVPDIKFWGEISMKENLSVILAFLEESGVHCEVSRQQNKTIVTIL